MYVAYEEMPKESRVWVYQASRSFNAEELHLIEENLKLFLNDWTKHGTGLKASYKIDYNQFITLVVDENFNAVSGCSIDASVRFLKEIETHIGVDLMNKMIVAYKLEDALEFVPMMEFSKRAKSGQVDAETIVFNNLVQTKADKDHNWEVPASASWHKRYF